MPFTAEQFFEVFEKYNQFIFPWQAVLILAAASCVILAFLWLWTGIVYQLIFFTRIHTAAYVFGALFILQGALFFHQGVIKKHLRFCPENKFFSILGLIFITYA